MNLFHPATDESKDIPPDMVEGLKVIATDVLEDYLNHTWPRNNRELYGCLMVSRELRRRGLEATNE